MRALAVCTCITGHQQEDARFPCHGRSIEHQSLQNSICVPTQGRGELNGGELNLTSPWKNLLRRYLFTSESLDRIDPRKNRHAQSCVNRGRENSHSETQLRNTSHNLFPSLSLCPCQTASVCLTHAHKHKPELSDKAYPVISL